RVAGGAVRGRHDEARAVGLGEGAHRVHPLQAGALADRDEHHLAVVLRALASDAVDHPAIAALLDAAAAGLPCAAGAVGRVEGHVVASSGWRYPASIISPSDAPSTESLVGGRRVDS